MKQLKILTMLLLTALSFAVTSCGGSDDDEPKGVYQQCIGSWYCNIPGNLGSVTLEIKDNETYSAVYTNGSQSKTITGSVYDGGKYFSLDRFFEVNRYADVVSSYISTTANYIAGELWLDVPCYNSDYDTEWRFTRLNQGSDSGTSTVSSKIVGTWQSVEHDDWGGSTIYSSTFNADGTFTDYLVIGGKKNNKMSGEFTFTGNTLKYLDDSNVVSEWGSEYTVTFSSDGKTMTFTNSTLNSYGGKIVFKKQ